METRPRNCACEPYYPHQTRTFPLRLSERAITLISNHNLTQIQPLQPRPRKPSLRIQRQHYPHEHHPSSFIAVPEADIQGRGGAKDGDAAACCFTAVGDRHRAVILRIIIISTCQPLFLSIFSIPTLSSPRHSSLSIKRTYIPAQTRHKYTYTHP